MGCSWKRTVAVLILIVMDNGLLLPSFFSPETMGEVLILIVMDNGLLPGCLCILGRQDHVLILIVMDNGLLQEGGRGRRNP